MSREPSIRERAISVLREHGELSAWALSQELSMERPTPGLYAALRTAERRGEVYVRLVEATHFHSFAGGMSQLYRVNDGTEEYDV